MRDVRRGDDPTDLGRRLARSLRDEPAGAQLAGWGSCVLVVLTREAGYNDELRDWIGDAGDVVEAPLTTTAYRDVGEVARRLDASRARRFLRRPGRDERARAALRRRRHGGARRGRARLQRRTSHDAQLLREEGVAVAATRRVGARRWLPSSPGDPSCTWAPATPARN